MALTRERRWLATPWPWLGAAIALALFAPNLAWQVAHGWPTLEWLGAHNAQMAAENPPARFLLEQLMLLGLPALPLALVGWHELLARPRLRALGLAALAVMVALLLQRAKSYYAMPLYPLLLAAGAVAFERLVASRRTVRGRRRLARSIAGAQALVLLVLPMSLPVLPVRDAVRLHLTELRDDYAEEIGWPELVATVAEVYRELPAGQREHTSILARNYGEAGAIDWYGPALGLPRAISGHNGYWEWLPADPPDDAVIALQPTAADLRPLCGRLRQVATVSNADGVPNQEAGRPVYLCSELRVPLRSWPLKRFTN